MSNSQPSIELKSLQTLAGSLAKREAVYNMLHRTKALVKLMNWAYRIEVLNNTLDPIEKDPNKADYWEDALKHELSREDRIEYCKALYYLVNKA